jgi:hypothetical protein
MLVTFNFHGGPLRGQSDVAEALGDLTKLAPDTVTLEFPSGRMIANAFRKNEVRLIEEPACSYKSVPGQILRYRNAKDGWHYVSHY